MNNQVLAKVNPSQINYVNRIFEGYEYVGVLSTVDQKQGLIMIRTTPDFYAEVVQILEHLPIQVELV